jgi:putative tricarboxylic transport membrane protein
VTSPKYQPGGVQPGGFQRWHGIAIGGVLLAVGLGICVTTFGTGTLPGQDSLGPRLFPVLIGGGLMILGLANAWTGWLALRQGPANEGALIPVSEAENVAEPGDWPTLLWVVAGLCVGALGYKTIGFIPSAWIVFIFTARGFAGHWNWKHALVGLIVVLIAFFGFTKGLGLPLPTGILSSILGGK